MTERNYSLPPIQLYSEAAQRDSSSKRMLAVGAALELIRADCLGGYGGESNSCLKLDFYMEKLSTYADAIQEALKTKGQ